MNNYALSSWLLLLTIIFYGCNLGQKINSMEIKDIINNGDIMDFIQDKCHPIKQTIDHPIFPYRANFEMGKEKVTFCSLPLVNGWVLRSEKGFAFFVLLDKENLVQVISDSYGTHRYVMDLEINDKTDSYKNYCWEQKDLNILLTKFINVKSIEKYDSCSMVVISNMNYRDIVTLPVDDPIK